MSDLTPVKVFLGIPSTGTRSDAQVYFLEEVRERYAGIVELVYPKQCVYRTFHDFARNAMVEEFLESDCDILWFLDSDVVPPKHVLDLIAIHGKKWEAAGAPYPIWMTPPGGTENTVIFTAYKGVVENETTKGIGITEVPRSGTEFIDALATGCLFLKRSLLERMEKPYFEFKFDPKTRQMREGEDLGFCLKASKIGVKFFTDYSMVCKHYKTVCLLDINNYAVSMSNDKVLRYDAEVRQKVQQAVMAAEQAGYERGLKDATKARPAASQGPLVSKGGLILPNSLR